MAERKRRIQEEEWRRLEEDFARQQQQTTNWKIQQYIEEQRERQKEMDYERELRKLGTLGW